MACSFVLHTLKLLWIYHSARDKCLNILGRGHGQGEGQAAAAAEGLCDVVPAYL